MTPRSNSIGYFKNLAIDIEEALYHGATVAQIARHFNITEQEVRAYIEQLQEADREPYAWD